jgi:aldehyde dehydrogenase (NAD+)
MAAVFARQKAAVADRRIGFGLAERRAALGRLAVALRGRQGEIVAALATDFGKPETEVLLTELLPLMQEIGHARRRLARWMRARWVAPGLSGFGTSARLRPEAKGVCLIMAPWNYPVNLALGPLISCLAAGNSAMIKPSEMTPVTSAVIARLVGDCFSDDLVAVVEGGREVAEHLLSLPFDHIFFTGSPEVGRVVMAAAARHLASVTLELGGKSPCIIGPDADLDRAARWIAFGKFANAGQTCIAPDHVFVHESVAEEFRAALRRAIDRLYPGGVAAGDLVQVVNENHLARLTGLLGDALSRGARLVAGGGAEGRRIAPTVIESITPDMAIDGQEIFGPILPLMTYSDIGTVISRINARPKPLALYVFAKDRALVQRVVAETSSGSVGVNLTMLQFSHPNLPFGGVNTSGIGSAHGEAGFRAFSHEKAVLVNRFSPAGLFFPPYTSRMRRLVEQALRWI